MSESAYARQRRDLASVNEQQQQPDSLMCKAHGCPNRWSIDDGENRVCSWHWRQPPHDWPAITEQQHHAITERARHAADPPPYIPPMSREDRIAVARELRDFVSQRATAHPLDGARSLRHAELHNGGILKSGKPITQAQREFWRIALARELEAENE